MYPVETLRIFEAGNIIEDYWIRVLKNSEGIQVLATQLPAYYISDEFEVHGRVDALVQHNKSEIRVHEVKTAKTLKYVQEPKTEHVEQIQFYLNALGLARGQLDYLDKSVFLNGSSPSVASIDRSFIIEADSSNFNNLIHRANNLFDALQRKQAPAPKHSWLCDYCLHKDSCDKLELKEIMR
jgi:CRISPR/Cas system-associated exonuclease Cas4 (RecB family)